MVMMMDIVFCIKEMRTIINNNLNEDDQAKVVINNDNNQPNPNNQPPTALILNNVVNELADKWADAILEIDSPKPAPVMADKENRITKIAETR